jgi:hypothetical protein
MNIKRAIVFSIMLYLASFIGFFVIQLLPGEQSFTEVPSLLSFVVGWVINIPIVLLLAKWYFKTVLPTAKSGLQLGIVAIIISLLLDGVSIVATLASGQSIDVFTALYTDWKFYVTVIEILLLTSVAGYEFDATDTAVTQE